MSQNITNEKQNADNIFNLPHAGAKIIDKSCVQKRIQKRARKVHKGCFGRAGILSGKKEYAGATALALYACLRSGAGYTVLLAPKKVGKLFLLQRPPYCKVLSLISKPYFCQLVFPFL